MILNIFKKPKKSSSSSEDRKYLLDENCNSFLLKADEMKNIIYNFNPIDRNEWLSTNTVNLYKNLIELISTMFTSCTDDSCPQMMFGSVVLSWVDDKNRKSKVTASQYISQSVIFIEKIITSEESVPTKLGNQYPINFIQIMQKIYRMMGTILCHLFTSHYNTFKSYELNIHLNTVFYHYMHVCELFGLIELKDVEPLEELVKKWNFFNSVA